MVVAVVVPERRERPRLHQLFTRNGPRGYKGAADGAGGRPFRAAERMSWVEAACSQISNAGVSQ
jgi:hypothetical protein